MAESRAISIADLRDALFRLAEDPGAFEALFTSEATPLGALDREAVRHAAAAGIVEIDDEMVRPQVNARLRGGRPFLMALSSDDVYKQDVWPESDAVLDRVRNERGRRRVLDLGTGSGFLAIEAALAGHEVVGTDVFDDTLKLASVNARLHGVSIDLRKGDLFSPVSGEKFDLVVVNMHYGGPSDLLRVEILQQALDVLSPDGELIFGTFLEWRGSAEPGIVTSILRPIAKRAEVRVEPITSSVKSHWFTVASDPTHVSRHRFTVSVRPGGTPSLHFRPATGIVAEPHVPLERLLGVMGRRPTDDDAKLVIASFRGEADVPTLELLLDQVAEGVVEIARPVEFQLLDDCRFLAHPCLEVHRVIVEPDGKLLPCTHGGPIGTVADTRRTVARTLEAQRDELRKRRGCASCPANTRCSQCPYPLLPEVVYCDLVRRRGRDFEVLAHLGYLLSLIASEPGPILVKLHPASRRIAASGDIDRTPLDEGSDFRELGEELRRQRAALIIGANTNLVVVGDSDSLHYREFPRRIMEVLELLLEGFAGDPVRRYAAERGVSRRELDAVTRSLGEWLVTRPTYREQASSTDTPESGTVQ